MKVLAIICLFPLCMALIPTPTGTLEVEITGWEDNSGQMIVALFDESSDFLKKDYMHVAVTDFNGKCVAIFKDIPQGVYAASVFHDKNLNGKLDSNMFGFPKEPYGFSNNVMGSFGPPSFTQSSFEVSLNTRVNIKLR